ncbi:MAG TPA: hypothetical protein VGK73_37610 [Polyangiaceae bacterium]
MTGRLVDWLRRRRSGSAFAAGVLSLAALVAAVPGCAGDSFESDEDETSAGAGAGGSPGGSGSGGSSGTAGAAGTTGGAGTSGGNGNAGGTSGTSAGVAGTSAGSGGSGGASSGSGGMAGGDGIPPGGTGGTGAGGSDGGSGGSLAGTGGIATAGTGNIDAGGVPNGGAGGATAGAGAGGAGTGGAAAGAAGLGGMGGMPVMLPLIENFEDGDMTGWNLYYVNAYAASLMPGTGANNSLRSLLLTKSEVTGFCCEGYYRQFPDGLTPKSVSVWLRSDAHGVAAGYVRLSPTTDSSNWIVSINFNNQALYVNGAQSIAYLYTPGQWYHVELREIDWTAHTFQAWIDGQSFGTLPMTVPDATSIKRIDLYNRDTAEGVTAPIAAYFDEIELRP